MTKRIDTETKARGHAKISGCVASSSFAEKLHALAPSGAASAANGFAV